MAKVKSWGVVDTPIEGVSNLTYPREVLNLGTDFRVKSENAGKEVVLTNITSPADRPEKIRISYSDVANIYSGTGIEASVLAPTKRGASVLVQLTDVVCVTDSVDPTYRIDLPLSVHTVLKYPVSEHINAADIQKSLSRLLSALFDSGSTTATRLESILRGSLTPKEL